MRFLNLPILSGREKPSTSSTDPDTPPQSPTMKPVIFEQDLPLLNLPPEILLQIYNYFDCPALVSLGRTCRKLRSLSLNDQLWANLLRPHLPADDFPPNPYPSSSYRDLYITHHPYWFVAKNRIWFSDDQHVGRIIVSKFDPRRGCIEAYRLLAMRRPSPPMLWPHQPAVVIHSFNPKVELWLDDPILKLPHDVGPFNSKQGWWEGEIRMDVGRPGHGTSASFFLARNLPMSALHPGMSVWPPMTIPDMPRVRAASSNHFRGKEHKPQTYDEISNTTFRMRNWSQFSRGFSHLGVRVGEELSTWSTLDPSLYTPTPQKPYQGVFVGDYAGHGCEFLLVMHTDKAPDPPPRPQSSIFDTFGRTRDTDTDILPQHHGLTPSTSAMEGKSNMSPAQWPRRGLPENTAAFDDESVFTGALEAVKLTGDPNVPRGEHTFIADDLGAKGFIRYADEQPFSGARVVKSRGHVAARGFVQGESIVLSSNVRLEADDQSR
jgi:hypothetical protein